MSDPSPPPIFSSNANRRLWRRWGGSITAALFLKEFISTDTIEWAHIDMAGPVWDDAQGGATGYGARTLAAWAAAQGK